MKELMRDYERYMMKILTENSQPRVEKMTEVMISIVTKITNGLPAFNLNIPMYIYKALQHQFPDRMKLSDTTAISKHSDNDEKEVTVIFFRDGTAYEKYKIEHKGNAP